MVNMYKHRTCNVQGGDKWQLKALNLMLQCATFVKDSMIMKATLGKTKSL